jgi:hypothetical protein
MLRSTEKKLTRDEIQDFENTLGVSLPDSFVNFYLLYNGGIPNLRYYQGNELSFFHHIKYGDKRTTIIYVINLLKEAERLPEGYIPFASDSGGWYYCLSTNEPNEGIIYVLPNGIVDQSPIFIAESFEDLINGLTDQIDY